MTLWVVVREDLHKDDEITVHATALGAIRAVDEFCGRYEDVFVEDEVEGWDHYTRSLHVDGPAAYIVRRALSE